MADYPVKPFPGIATGKPFEVIDQPSNGGAYCDHENHVIAVPFDPSHLSDIKRTHELLHAKYSRLLKSGDMLTLQLMNWAEDIRIGYLGQKIGYASVLCGCESCRATAAEYLPNTLMTLTQYGCPYPEQGAKLLLYTLSLNRLPIEWTDDDTRKSGDAPKLMSAAQRHMRAKVRYATARKVGAELLRKALFPPRQRPTGKGIDNNAGGETGDGRMTIYTLPHTIRSCERRNAPSDTGAVPRSMHRAALDGMVFSRRRQELRRGTILVDASGSMSWTQDALTELLATVPMGTVAYYSGSGSKGELVIAAQDGYRAESLRPPRGGNIVDCEAVDWLARQGGPYDMVSDRGFSIGPRGEAPKEYVDTVLARIGGQLFRSADALLKHLAETGKR